MNTKGTTSFRNPFWSEGFADPFVLKSRDRYYAYATENNGHPSAQTSVFPILTSTDMVSWQPAGKAMAALGEPYFFYWAPEVTEYNGQFLLYYAVHTEEFAAGIRVAVADNPTGPFVDSRHDLTSAFVPWAIDPHVFRDQDGQWYLFMTIEFNNPSTGLVGSGNVVDRMLDPFTLQGTLTQVTHPSQSWQLFEAQRASKGGQDWYTVEGSTVLCHRQRYYEMYSGGCFMRDNYAVNYATSETPMGPAGLQDTSWHDKQGLRRLVQGNADLIGPGHNSLVAGPNNVESYIAYHAWQPDMQARRPCLDRIFWHGEDLWTPAPISTPQPAPAQPRLRDLFEQSTLQPHWQPQSGVWNILRDAVVQQDVAATSAELSNAEPLSPTWVLEINVRAISGSGDYGIALYNQGQVAASLTIIPEQLQLKLELPAHQRQQTQSLPAGTNLMAWHQLLVSVAGSILTVQFDGIQILETLIDQPAQLFALLTRGCSAEFSAISLTDHFRDEFLNKDYSLAQMGWQDGSETGLQDWHIDHGTLRQSSAREGEHILIKGPAYEHYEYGATFKLTNAENSSRQAACGLVIQPQHAENIFIGLTHNQATWTLQITGTANMHTEKAIPADANFDPTDWHTLRTDQRHTDLRIFLDGSEMLTLKPSLPLSTRYKVGIATRNAAATFMSVWQTGYTD